MEGLLVGSICSTEHWALGTELHWPASRGDPCWSSSFSPLVAQPANKQLQTCRLFPQFPPKRPHRPGHLRAPALLCQRAQAHDFPTCPLMLHHGSCQLQKRAPFLFPHQLLHHDDIPQPSKAQYHIHHRLPSSFSSRCSFQPAPHFLLFVCLICFSSFPFVSLTRLVIPLAAQAHL